MKDNKNYKWFATQLVVNCFQKLLSSWWRTTSSGRFSFNNSLWIAFKNYYLRDEGQLPTHTTPAGFCCELLSKIIIFVMKDNYFLYSYLIVTVVNCFQKLLSSWWRTTVYFYVYFYILLWIAFKNYYLRDEGQQSKKIKRSLACCELLSKIIIFVMKDNYNTMLE